MLRASKVREERGEMMSNNVNLITICSLVIGNNLPMHLNRKEQQVEEKAPAQPIEEVPTEDKEEAKGSAPCIYRGLIKKVLFVGVLALVLSRWCRKRREEPDVI